jgi:excisionase family DNA binding protein
MKTTALSSGLRMSTRGSGKDCLEHWQELIKGALGSSVLALMTHRETAQFSIIDQLKQRNTFMRTAEVMELFGVTRATLCGWVRSGTIAAVRIGKENKFDPAEVIRYLTIHAT